MEKITQVFRILPDGSVTTNKMVLTVVETARALGYGHGTMRNKLQACPEDPLGCGLSPVRIGKSIRFLVADIVQAVQAAQAERDSAQKSSARPAASNAARKAKKRIRNSKT
jgi:hypothetical protein